MIKSLHNYLMISVLVFSFVTHYGHAQDTLDLKKLTVETESSVEILWHIKAYHPNAKLLNIKAIDKDGNIHDVKAVQNSDDTSVLDVKAFVNGQRLPVKLIVSDGERYFPVKAIGEDGTIIDIKAILGDGRVLGVKGVSKSGNIVHIRAITEGGGRFNIIAISPKGKQNVVKGVKMMNTKVETTIKGVSIFAHIKALHQK